MVISRSLQKSIKRSPGFHKLYISTKSPKTRGPSFIVKEKIAQGQVKYDRKQIKLVDNLQEVYENIQGYSPGRFLSRVSPKGLYIYGSVGVGKTMLMDIFYQSLLGKTKKRRSHFNNFMTDVHSRIHKLKKKTRKRLSWGDKSHAGDPIAPVARELVKESWLLCFDEFQVTDIGDAMILKRLFTEMFENGMVMVATSNRAPDDLYKNGLQRVNFLPFISILKKHCKVVNIVGNDYRTSMSTDTGKHYFLLNEPGTKSGMDNAYNELCELENKTPSSRTLNVLGHKVDFRNTCGRVLYASFKELCGRPLSAADYIQIAKNFNVILLKDVPVMNVSSRNQARRFILLIDTLYDNGVRLKMSAAAPPGNLFSDMTDGASYREEHRILMDDLKIEKESENAKASLFEGSDEVFAFERTVSRIIEMCSNPYWNRHDT